MTSLEIGFIALGFALILVFSLLGSGRRNGTFREIKAFSRLRKNIELSVEDGTRLHVSLGRGGLLGPQSAAAFAGLNLLREVSQVASDSDQPPLATTGEAVLALLAQDTLRANYKTLNIGEEFSNRYAQVVGLSAMAYSAGLMSPILDNEVSASALVGNFGEEVGLITTAGQRSRSFTLGGSDGLSSQAILFASANEALIGEELYASAAYLGGSTAQEASLRGQDILRILIALSIIGLALSNLIDVVL